MAGKIPIFALGLDLPYLCAVFPDLAQFCQQIKKTKYPAPLAASAINK